MNVEILEGKTIAIVGSREFPDLQLVRSFVRMLPQSMKVISGGARGVDTVAIDTARLRNMDYEVFPPDKTKPIPERYYKRNRQIVRAADIVVIYWDGKSGGSLYVKEFCEKIRREHIVIASDGSEFTFKDTTPPGMYVGPDDYPEDKYPTYEVH